MPLQIASDGAVFYLPECAHEWTSDVEAITVDQTATIKDANGNTLQDGDTVTVIKDLKVKGSSLVVKVGTKVKNIRLVAGDHDIDCKIDRNWSDEVEIAVCEESVIS